MAQIYVLGRVEGTENDPRLIPDATFFPMKIVDGNREALPE